MALTSEEESKLKAIIAAFDGGQQVDDLPQSDMSATDKIVEVFDKNPAGLSRCRSKAPSKWDSILGVVECGTSTMQPLKPPLMWAR